MILTLKDFGIAQIAASGQCFRMEPLAKDRFRAAALDRYIEIQVLPSPDPENSRDASGQRQVQTCRFSCSREEFDGFWRSYFDLDFDYSAVKKSILPEDAYLRRAAGTGGGIRILRQDLWETLISFLISQQNNIPRIRRCIRLLCEAYGTPLDGSPDLHSFPTAEALAAADEEALRRCNLGYRAKYVLAAARSVAGGQISLDAIRNMEFPEAREALMEFYGVGVKVADCVCLFALHHLEAFPVDTHIRQVLEREYPEGFPFSAYAPLAGILQQYMVYHDLTCSPS